MTIGDQDMTIQPTVTRPGCSRSELEAVRNAVARAAVPGQHVVIPLDSGILLRLTNAAELAHRHTDKLLAVIPELEAATASLATQAKRLGQYEKRLMTAKAERERMAKLIRVMVDADRRGSLSPIPPIIPTLAGWARDLFRDFSAEQRLDAFLGDCGQAAPGHGIDEKTAQRQARAAELQKLAGSDDE